MNFLAPAAFAFAAAIPVVVLFYLLKRKRVVKLVSSIKMYPLAQKDNPKPTKVILNGGKPFNSDWPKDIRYFEYLAEGLTDVAIEHDQANQQ